MASSVIHGPLGRSETQRFTDMVRFARSSSECWEWIGGKKAAGYGQMAVKRDGKWKRAIAHRYAYELWVGPIPEGYEIDHLCANRCCVNPAHLEAITLAENRDRRDRRQGWGVYKTHCINGHDLAVVGTYWSKDSPFRCKECQRQRR